jgi:hypothetical protein
MTIVVNVEATNNVPYVFDKLKRSQMWSFVTSCLRLNMLIEKVRGATALTYCAPTLYLLSIHLIIYIGAAHLSLTLQLLLYLYLGEGLQLVAHLDVVVVDK